MPRALLDEAALAPLAGSWLMQPAFVRRRAVLRETLAAFAERGPALHAAAAANLERWRQQRTTTPRRAGDLATIEVYAGDWGEVCATLTRRHGERFAVLNMANAFVPGGGYVEGAPAQEENLFRRSDAHFTIDDSVTTADGERYLPAFSALLQAEGGRVHCDPSRPLVCIRGAEDRSRADLGYRWLGDDEVVPFVELRAAADDLRDGRPFDPDDARRRIEAQLDTLRDAGQRFALLSAFGCGAFCNPAPAVAALYRDALQQRRGDFDVVAFAIFHPGYGPDNFTPFRRVLGPA